MLKYIKRKLLKSHMDEVIKDEALFRKTIDTLISSYFFLQIKKIDYYKDDIYVTKKQIVHKILCLVIRTCKSIYPSQDYKFEIISEFIDQILNSKINETKIVCKKCYKVTNIIRENGRNNTLWINKHGKIQFTFWCKHCDNRDILTTMEDAKHYYQE
jgi:hypothetical protein